MREQGNINAIKSRKTPCADNASIFKALKTHLYYVSKEIPFKTNDIARMALEKYKEAFGDGGDEVGKVGENTK